MIRLSTLICFMLAACSEGAIGSGGSAAGTYATILDAPPYPPVARLGPDLYSPTLEDRRFRFADNLEQRHLPMLRRLKRGEIGNFGGVEWRWRNGPENGGLGKVAGVAYFLNQPAATLRRYTGDPLFQSAKADFARSDQERVAREWAERIGVDVASPGFGNMSVPWLNIAVSRADFEAMRTAKRWTIPTNLILRFSAWAEPDLPAVADEVKPSIRYFAHETKLAGPTPDLATYDAIVLRDGCFFIDEEGENDPLVIFPLGVGVYRDEEGHLAFRSRYSAQGARMARVGTRMQLGYRSTANLAPPKLIEACGRHPVVIVKSVDQAAGYGGVWSAVKEYAAREKISEREALRGTNACLLEQERILAGNRLRGTRAEPKSCPSAVHVPPPPPAPPTQGKTS